MRNKDKPPFKVTHKLVPKQRAWMLDCDYYDKLNVEEKRFYAQFNDEYYRSDFRYAKPMHKTAEQKRERYNMQNENYRDAYARAQVTGDLYLGGSPSTDGRQAGPVDFMPSPSYLDTLEYKTAVAELRKIVDVPAKRRTKRQKERIKILQLYIKSQRGNVDESE